MTSRRVESLGSPGTATSSAYTAMKAMDNSRRRPVGSRFLPSKTVGIGVWASVGSRHRGRMVLLLSPKVSPGSDRMPAEDPVRHLQALARW